MNIFKILANGNGTINEVNVSAFLGYLLDPRADHGLGHEFLKAFLEQATFEEGFDPEKYEYQIFYEQAFKKGNSSKEIVDIVLVCYKIDLGKGKESLVKKFLNNKKEINKIFLIENKIRSGSKNSGQLGRQFNSTTSELNDDIKEKIYSIFVTPENQKFNKEFMNADVKRKTHLFWKRTDDEFSIRSILTNIITKEGIGEIEPLNEYTLHTIKAFIQFIENDFKSEKQEENARKKDGSYTKKYEELNLKFNIEGKLKQLQSELESINPNLKGLIFGPDMSKKRHPKLFLRLDGIKLVLNAGYTSRDKLSLGFSIDKKIRDSKSKLKALAEKLKLDIKKPNSKYDSYCRTEEMEKTIKLTNVIKINEAIKKAIKLIKK